MGNSQSNYKVDVATPVAQPAWEAEKPDDGKDTLARPPSQTPLVTSDGDLEMMTPRFLIFVGVGSSLWAYKLLFYTGISHLRS